MIDIRITTANRTEDSLNSMHLSMEVAQEPGAEYGCPDSWQIKIRKFRGERVDVETVAFRLNELLEFVDILQEWKEKFLAGKINIQDS